MTKPVDSFIKPLCQVDRFGDLEIDETPGNLNKVVVLTPFPQHYKFTIHSNVYQHIFTHFGDAINYLKEHPQAIAELKPEFVMGMIKAWMAFTHFKHPLQGTAKQWLVEMDQIFYPSRPRGEVLMHELDAHQNIGKNFNAYLQLLLWLEIEESLFPSPYYLKYFLYAIQRMSAQDTFKIQNYLRYALKSAAEAIVLGRYTHPQIIAFENSLCNYIATIQAALRGPVADFSLVSTHDPQTSYPCSFLLLVLEHYHWNTDSFLPRINLGTHQMFLDFPPMEVKRLATHLNNRYTPFNPDNPAPCFLFASQFFTAPRSAATQLV